MYPTHDSRVDGVSVTRFKEAHPGKVTPAFVELMQCCLGNGFGNRSCSKCRGMNYYYGLRGSEMTSPSPVEGPGSATKCQYYRSKWKSYQYFPLLVRHWNRLKITSTTIARKSDYNMVTYLLQGKEQEQNTSTTMPMNTNHKVIYTKRTPG